MLAINEEEGSHVRFRLNGVDRDLDAASAKARILGRSPEPLQTHWVEVEGRRYPPKQAFQAASGIPRGEFTSHIAMRMLRRLGFETSDFGTAEVPERVHANRSDRIATPPTGLRTYSEHDALEAFAELDAFLMAQRFTERISALEHILAGADVRDAAEIATGSGMGIDLVEAALIVRERVGLLDSVIHASVITQTIPLILEEGERVVVRPSLGAGNDSTRRFDLETNLRVAEFKLSSWKGADGGRKRGLFADLVGLTLDETGRKRQMFVVGPLPKAFLETSSQDAAKTLAKSALRLRTPDLSLEGVSVSSFTRASRVEIVDLATIFPSLR